HTMRLGCMSLLVQGVPMRWHCRRRCVSRRARWLSRCTRSRPPCRNDSMYRRTPAAHNMLVLGSLWARIARWMPQECLEWLAGAVVSSGLTLCVSTDLAAPDLRAIVALRANLSDQGAIRVLLRQG